MTSSLDEELLDTFQRLLNRGATLVRDEQRQLLAEVIELRAEVAGLKRCNDEKRRIVETLTRESTFHREVITLLREDLAKAKEALCRRNEELIHHEWTRPR